jgi:isopenicillin N synthase-like dioxygenase
MLGQDRDGLDPYFATPNPILRLLHYPPMPEREANQFGSAPHTDYGCLTSSRRTVSAACR